LKGALTTTKDELSEAGKRVAVNRSWGILKKGLIQNLVKTLPKTQQKQVTAMMETPLGEVLLRVAASVMLQQLPVNDPRKDLLAEELRVKGYEEAIDAYASPLAAVVEESLGELDGVVAAMVASDSE